MVDSPAARGGAGSERRGRRTAVFTKHPTPGRVKTRLCPPLTDAQAARLAEAMLQDAVARCLAGRFVTEIVFDPPAEAPWFARRFPGLARTPQCGEGLGARLAHHVEQVFARGDVSSLVVVGSDQPLVPLARLEEAHERLQAGAECVLGPDTGGGYYLVGLARPVPELFTTVPMSTPGMCAATEALARARGLEVSLLASHPDVDRPGDLENLRAALALPSPRPGGPDDPVHTRRVLAELALLPR